MRSGSKMDVVLLLSRRFRAQDINAPPDYTAMTNALQVKEEAHDSGTGSDEEAMTRASPLARTNASEHQEHSEQVYDNPDASRSSRDGCSPPSSTSLGHSPASSSPVGFRRLAADDFPPVALYSSTDRHSPTGSDFERSSLGGLEASTTLSDLGVDCSSSSSSSCCCEGEDLVMMTTGNRKRHQLSDDSCIFPDEEEDDEDDDIEICELFGDDDDDDDDEDDEDDVLGGGSRRCRRPVAALGSTSCSPTFLSSSTIPPFTGRGASPRKRCRQDAGGDAATSLRPNLDFYKMQKTSIVRRNCIINRPRPAKLMVLNGSQGQKSNATTFGPSSFTFRSLEFN